MKCTECGSVIRPVVSVDIDGTLGNYHDHFVFFAEEYVGRRLSASYDGSEEFSDHLGLEKSIYRDIKLAYRQGGMKRSMPQYHGARDFMIDLRNRSVEVWISTTRPWMRLDNIDPDTRHWLDRNGIHWDYMIYGEDKYDQLVSRVDPERIVAVIDDLSDQCIAAAKALEEPAMEGCRVYQPARSHNRGDPFVNRFTNFHQMTEIIKARVRWLYGDELPNNGASALPHQ